MLANQITVSHTGFRFSEKHNRVCYCIYVCARCCIASHNLVAQAVPPFPSLRCHTTRTPKVGRSRELKGATISTHGPRDINQTHDLLSSSPSSSSASSSSSSVAASASSRVLAVQRWPIRACSITQQQPHAYAHTTITHFDVDVF